MKGNPFFHAAIHALAPEAPIESFVEDDSAVGQMTPMPVRLPIEGVLPPFDGAITWLNAPPLTPAGPRGKVVLIDFWTSTCINWLRTLPYVRAWAEKYKAHGVVVIGVHSPEFPFEHDVENVRRAATDMRVEYPIAVDNDYAVWSAFNNHYWPALYIVDAQGQIRHHHFGEGAYDQAETVIQHLMAEAGLGGFDPTLVWVDARGIEAPADWSSLESLETYLGYERAENFASPGGAARDMRRTYAAPPRLQLNQWALPGDWTVRGQAAVLNTANGRITYRFHARDLHLVLAPAAGGSSVRFRVLLDGQSPGDAHGVDVDDQGNGVVTEPRLYQLIRQRQPLLIDSSRSSFSVRAWRLLCSRSADPRQRLFTRSPRPGGGLDSAPNWREIGMDIDANGQGVITEQRLYQLIPATARHPLPCHPFGFADPHRLTFATLP